MLITCQDRRASRNFHVCQGSKHLSPMTHFLKSPKKHSSANSWIKEGKGGSQEIWDQIKKSVNGFLKVHVLGHFSCIHFFATLWTVAFQAPLSMGFSSQEYWSGLPYPSPRDLPDPGIKPESPALAGRLDHWATWFPYTKQTSEIFKSTFNVSKVFWFIG